MGLGASILQSLDSHHRMSQPTADYEDVVCFAVACWQGCSHNRPIYDFKPARLGKLSLGDVPVPPMTQGPRSLPMAAATVARIAWSSASGGYRRHSLVGWLSLRLSTSSGWKNRWPKAPGSSNSGLQAGQTLERGSAEEIHPGPQLAGPSSSGEPWRHLASSGAEPVVFCERLAVGRTRSSSGKGWLWAGRAGVGQHALQDQRRTGRAAILTTAHAITEIATLPITGGEDEAF